MDAHGPETWDPSAVSLLGAQALLPDWMRKGELAPRSPEVKLAGRMIEFALSDLAGKDWRLAAQARRWIFGPDAEFDYPFAVACAAVKLDPDAVRERIRKGGLTI